MLIYIKKHKILSNFQHCKHRIDFALFRNSFKISNLYKLELKFTYLAVVTGVVKRASTEWMPI